MPEAFTEMPPKLGPGRMVLVVGPSGAGKDTLMSALKQKLDGRPGIHFARRAVTRPADEETEEHDTLSLSEFYRMVDAGDAALSWEAHGFGYMIPKKYDEAILAGDTVIANGSRRVLEKSAGKYRTAIVLLITAPAEVLAERLAERGRESKKDIQKRLERACLVHDSVPNLIRIENTGTVDDGVKAMISALRL